MGIIYFNETFETSYNHIQANSVDLFWLDPPYFITGNKQQNQIFKDNDRGSWDRQWSSKQEYAEWLYSMLSLAFNQLKASGSLYICMSWQHSYLLHDALNKTGFIVQNRITWKRDKGRGNKTNWKSMHEDIFFATKHKTDYTFNVNSVMVEKKVIAPYKNDDGTPKDWWINEFGEKTRLTYPGNLWTEFCVPYWSMHEVKSYAKTKKTPNNIFTKHNTQKPKDLVKKCLLASSNENDLIVDYFSGSGTTAIAAKELNRNCIVFDIDSTCIDILKTRLENE